MIRRRHPLRPPRLLRKPGLPAVAVLCSRWHRRHRRCSSLIYAVCYTVSYAGADALNAIVVDAQHPELFSAFSLARHSVMTEPCSPLIRLLGFNNGHLRSPAADCRRHLGIYLTENAGAFFGVRPLSRPTSSHPMQRTAATPSLFSTTPLSGRLLRRRSPRHRATLEIDHAPTHHRVHAAQLSHSVTPPVSAMSHCRAVLMRAVANVPPLLPAVDKLRRTSQWRPPTGARAYPARDQKQHSGVSAWHLALQPIIVLTRKPAAP